MSLLSFYYSFQRVLLLFTLNQAVQLLLARCVAYSAHSPHKNTLLPYTWLGSTRQCPLGWTTIARWEEEGVEGWEGREGVEGWEKQEGVEGWEGQEGVEEWEGQEGVEEWEGWEWQGGMEGQR